jgi:hypothetical protein
MHTEILSNNQKKMLSFISTFKKDYYLVGGTAIALYLGHRNSIDFDLFSLKDVKRKNIKNTLEKHHFDYTVLHEAFDQLHVLVYDVKLTFFNYPFKIDTPVSFESYIKMPSLIDLGAMKAFALGGRAKWKDYVDLYFLLKFSSSLKDISENAKKIYGDKFNIKLFKQQLTWFDDIDYSESIVYLGNIRPSEQEVKDFLTEQALTAF